MCITSIQHYYIIKNARGKATRRCADNTAAQCAIHAPWNWCALRSVFVYRIIFVY